MTTPEQILKKYWGHQHFRPAQAEIINAVCAGRDVLAMLPTGGGKSICFQIPAMLSEGVCLVITPLIALMEDQVAQLKKRAIVAVSVHSGMSRQAIDIALDNCAYGKVKFLYVSPERLQTELFRERLKKINVNLVAVDEAHCISQWGYDFRPPYLLIAGLRQLIPDTTFIALTASATRQVAADIADKLSLRHPLVFQESVARKNLSFVVREYEDKERQCLQILQKVRGAAIVYMRSRKATEQLALWLNNHGVQSIYYHAGLSYVQRVDHQKKWIDGQVRVMVATNAFGMGIDKADVRLVVHMDMPENMEAYYQEAGRAGRDGRKAYAVLIFHQADTENLRKKVREAQPDIDEIRNVYQGLANYFRLAVGSGQGESFDFDLQDFCQRFGFNTASVYAVLKKLQEQGIVQLNEGFYRPAQLHFQVDKKRLYAFQVSNAHYDPLIKYLLRLYGAALFSDFVTIHEGQIGKAMNWNIQEVKIALGQLQKMQFLFYEQATDSPQITFLTARQDASRLHLNRQQLEERRALALQKMETMIRYAGQTHGCRMQIIQSYFGEETMETCGICDVCIEKRKRDNRASVNTYRERILSLLDKKPMTSEELEQAVDPDDHDLLIGVIREMLDSAEIAFDEFWVLRKVK